MNNNHHEEKIIITLTPYLMAFPQSRMTKEGLVIYAKALSSLSIAEINAAMLKLMRTLRFFPTVAEIFEQAGAMREFVSRSSLPSPDEAWGEAMREAHDKFVYGEWELSTPEVEQAVNNFGKMALCKLTPEGMNTARAQFMKIYESIVSRAKEKATNRQVLNSLPQRQMAELLGDTVKNFQWEDKGWASLAVIREPGESECGEMFAVRRDMTQKEAASFTREVAKSRM